MRFAYELPLWWERTIPQLAQADFHGLLLARWIGQSLLVSLLIFLADYLLGAGLLRAFHVRLPSSLRLAVSLALGSGLGGLLVFLLGCVRLLQPGAVILAVLLSGLFGWWILRGSRWWRPFEVLRPSGVSLFLLLLFLPLIVLQQLDLQMPVLEGDSTLYHMASARWYAEHHRLAYHPGIRFNAQPQQTVLLYLRQWLVTGEETNIKLVNWEFLAILLSTLMGGARLLGARRLAPAAAIFVLASPVFCWTAKVEMADLGLTTYLALGVVLLLVALRRHHWRYAGLAGLMLGFAGASKLQGMVIVAGFVVSWILVYLAHSDRCGVRRRAWEAHSYRCGLAMAIGIVLPGIGWWIRSLIFTGSPAYPFFSGSPESKALFAASVRYGFGHDFLALLALPWRMVTESSYIFADPYIFGVPFLILLVVGALALISVRGRLPPAILFLSGGFVVYFAFWFMTGQVMRYLASLLPVMALLFVAALSALGCRRVRWWAVLPLTLVAMLAAATPSRVLLHGVLPPVTNLEQTIVQVTALPFYRAARALNAMAHPRKRVYLWFCEDTRFHVRPMSYGDWFGEYSFGWVGRNTTTTQQMLDRLRGAGFEYIVVDRERSKVGGSIYQNDFLQSAFVLDEGPAGDSQLVVREGRYRVFKLD